MAHSDRVGVLAYVVSVIEGAGYTVLEPGDNSSPTDIKRTEVDVVSTERENWSQGIYMVTTTIDILMRRQASNRGDNQAVSAEETEPLLAAFEAADNESFTVYVMGTELGDPAGVTETTVTVEIEHTEARP